MKWQSCIFIHMPLYKKFNAPSHDSSHHFNNIVKQHFWFHIKTPYIVNPSDMNLWFIAPFQKNSNFNNISQNTLVQKLNSVRAQYHIVDMILLKKKTKRVYRELTFRYFYLKKTANICVGSGKPWYYSKTCCEITVCRKFWNNNPYYIER